MRDDLCADLSVYADAQTGRPGARQSIESSLERAGNSAQTIMQRLQADEAVSGAVSLYLDFLNLFLFILRLLNGRR